MVGSVIEFVPKYDMLDSMNEFIPKYDMLSSVNEFSQSMICYSYINIFLSKADWIYYQFPYKMIKFWAITSTCITLWVLVPLLNLGIYYMTFQFFLKWILKLLYNDRCDSNTTEVISLFGTGYRYPGLQDTGTLTISACICIWRLTMNDMGAITHSLLQ